MATLMNPFDLLGDEAEDPSQLIAAQQKAVDANVAPKKASAQAKGKDATSQQKKVAAVAQLPTKPAPPSQAVREAKNDVGRVGGGGGRGGRGYGRGRGGGGFLREPFNNENSFGSNSVTMPEEGETGKFTERRAPFRGGYRGGGSNSRRGGFNNGEAGDGERPRRTFDRRSASGRVGEMKREGAGRGNWGTPSDEIAQVTEEVVNENEKNLVEEKPAGEEDSGDASKENKENTTDDPPEEKEPEDNEMTLEEYEKKLEEKRKALQAHKSEGRKVDPKEFESMQPLSKKDNDDIFIKLGSQKDKRKDAYEKEEKAKKSVSINEFLKPAEGEIYYRQGGGRGRGRGRGRGFGGNNVMATPSIEDPGQFPNLVRAK